MLAVWTHDMTWHDMVSAFSCIWTRKYSKTTSSGPPSLPTRYSVMLCGKPCLDRPVYLWREWKCSNTECWSLYCSSFFFFHQNWTDATTTRIVPTRRRTPILQELPRRLLNKCFLAVSFPEAVTCRDFLVDPTFLFVVISLGTVSTRKCSSISHGAPDEFKKCYSAENYAIISRHNATCTAGLAGSTTTIYGGKMASISLSLFSSQNEKTLICYKGFLNGIHSSVQLDNKIC